MGVLELTDRTLATSGPAQKPTRRNQRLDSSEGVRRCEVLKRSSRCCRIREQHSTASRASLMDWSLNPNWFENLMNHLSGKPLAPPFQPNSTGLSVGDLWPPNGQFLHRELSTPPNWAAQAVPTLHLTAEPWPPPPPTPSPDELPDWIVDAELGRPPVAPQFTTPSTKRLEYQGIRPEHIADVKKYSGPTLFRDPAYIGELTYPGQTCDNVKVGFCCVKGGPNQNCTTVSYRNRGFEATQDYLNDRAVSPIRAAFTKGCSKALKSLLTVKCMPRLICDLKDRLIGLSRMILNVPCFQLYASRSDEEASAGTEAEPGVIALTPNVHQPRKKKQETRPPIKHNPFLKYGSIAATIFATLASFVAVYRKIWRSSRKRRTRKLFQTKGCELAELRPTRRAEASLTVTAPLMVQADVHSPPPNGSSYSLGNQSSFSSSNVSFHSLGDKSFHSLGTQSFHSLGNQCSLSSSNVSSYSSGNQSQSSLSSSSLNLSNAGAFDEGSDGMASERETETASS